MTKDNNKQATAGIEAILAKLSASDRAALAKAFGASTPAPKITENTNPCLLREGGSCFVGGSGTVNVLGVRGSLYAAEALDYLANADAIVTLIMAGEGKTREGNGLVVEVKPLAFDDIEAKNAENRKVVVQTGAVLKARVAKIVADEEVQKAAKALSKALRKHAATQG